MNEHEAIELVTQVVCRTRNVEASQVAPDADLVETLGFDSLDTAEVLAALHKEIGYDLNVCSVRELRTVTDIARSLVMAREGSRT